VSFLRKILNFIFRDFHWKLLSLALAFIIWLWAVNASDMLQNESYTRLLVVNNQDILESEDIRVLNLAELEKQEIKVLIRDTESAHGQYKDADQANRISASINLNDVIIANVLASEEPYEVQLQVDVEIPESGERLSTQPRNVYAVLDRYESRSFDIVEYYSGSVDSGYEFISVESQLQTVTISAARSILAQVETVRAEVIISGATGSYDEVVKLKVLDINGEDMTEKVELSTDETSMSVVVLPHKLVPLAIGHTGLLPGRMVTKIDILPSEVSVVGERDLLVSTEIIRLEPYDITDRTETFPTTVEVTLPEGLTLKEGEPETVSVTFTIEPLMTKEFAFPTARIRRIGDNEFSMRFASNDDIPITIQGAESVISNMASMDLNAEVDISGLDVGEHTLPLSVTTLQNTSLVNTPMVTVIITDVPPDIPNLPLDENGIPVFNNGDSDEGQTGEGLPGIPDVNNQPISGIMNGNNITPTVPPADGSTGGGADVTPEPTADGKEGDGGVNVTPEPTADSNEGDGGTDTTDDADATGDTDNANAADDATATGDTDDTATHDTP
jgi:YbbR domain-containing protein